MKPSSFACLVALAAMPACNPAPEAPAARPKPLTAAEQQAQIARLELTYAAPEQIDSSAYVLYPLVLDKTEEGEESYSSSSGRYEVKRYWNLAFYDPATGAAHLLDATRRMVIFDYAPKAAGDKATSVSAAVFARYVRGSFARVDKLLYYSVRTLDYNRDGELTRDDPNYLFISDKAGRGFRQISPPTYHVESWQLLPATNSILIQATRDSDHNQQFDEHDAPEMLVYDLATGGPARPVFSAPFQTQLKQALHAQWARPAGQ